MAKQHEALQRRVHHPRGVNLRGLIIKPIQKGRELRLAERAPTLNSYIPAIRATAVVADTSRYPTWTKIV